MTYSELLLKLQHLTDEQLSSDVTVKIGDELYAAENLLFQGETDVLDKGHPYVVILLE